MAHITKKKKAVFKKNTFYHIYNKSVGNELMFRDGENYRFFMQRWSEYLDDYTDVFAYCLMPDHFHFLIRLKKNIKGDIHSLAGNAFRNFFASYTLSFNKYWNRTGTLFAHSYKRIPVERTDYLSALIRYIHENPVEHKFVDDCRLWKYSSYRAILSHKDTKVKRNEVLTLLGGEEEYRNLHSTQFDWSSIDHLIVA